MSGAKQLRQEKKKHRTADKEDKKMNTNTVELNQEAMEQANGGLFDGLIEKTKKILMDIGNDFNQSFCRHNYIRTGETRMRPFCCKDVLQHELFCTKCHHKKWTED